ncbi:hypothetical protein EON64_15520 [archaeon]|nr:MAG: hypothetical protein EON64_15520 [archaeon]
MCAAGAATTIAVLILCLYIAPAYQWRRSAWVLMGLQLTPLTPLAVLITCLLMVVFYLGPIVTYIALLVIRKRQHNHTIIATIIEDAS